MHQTTDGLSILQVPDLLRQQPRWIRWTLTRDERSGRMTKVPDCSTRDPKALRSFDIAMRAGAVDATQGLGFVFSGGVDTPDGRIFALDLDACRDPSTGAIEPWAMEIVAAYGYGFVEITPSGTGLRVWFVARRFPKTLTKAKVKPPGNAAPNVGTKMPELQVFGYGAAQYVTVTGRLLPGCSLGIPVVDSLDWLVRTFGLETSDTPREKRELPHGTGAAPSVDTIRASIAQGPFAAAVLKADWRSALRDDAEDKSASAAYYRVALAVLRAANGHGQAALDFLLHETDWGLGLVDDSADASKYTSPSWVASELRRMDAKHAATVADAAAVFDDGFDCASFVPPEGLEPMTPDAPGASALKPPSPILSIASPRPLFDAPPPARVYLLKHANGAGFIPRGKVGLLNAAGGTGKTTALVQLAVALATCKPWLGHFMPPAQPQRVLMLLGEEDEDEVRRKLYWTCAGMGLSPSERDAVEELVVALPLAGHALPLLRKGEWENLEGTEHGDAILERMQAHDDWGLVVIDPVSRFTAVNVESDNITATRYVQELERFAAVAGGPSVAAIGHTSKQSRKENDADFRGVTGLYDAARWALTMQSTDTHRVALRIRKNNLAPPAPQDAWFLNRGQDGVLAVETSEQAQADAQAYAAAQKAEEEAEARAEEARRNAMVARVVQRVRDVPGLTRSEIAAGIPAKTTNVFAGIALAAERGLIVAEPMGKKMGHFVNSLLK